MRKIDDFKKSILTSDVTVTPKIHAVIRDENGLKVTQAHPNFGQNLLKAAVAYNSQNL